MEKKLGGERLALTNKMHFKKQNKNSNTVIRF